MVGVNYPEIAFLGDDLPDLAAIRKVGLGMTVANGHHFVVEHADWQTQARGGEGAVREACELIMRAQGSLQAALEAYL
jgi:3-deoxy-D-manno-octulosonate 8-phosphate phosphatase (KDO 8-P phosphatase)